MRSSEGLLEAKKPIEGGGREDLRGLAASAAEGGGHDPGEHHGSRGHAQPHNDLDPGGGLKHEGDQEDEGEDPDHGRGGDKAADPPSHLGPGQDLLVAFCTLAHGVWGGIGSAALADPGHLGAPGGSLSHSFAAAPSTPQLPTVCPRNCRLSR